jgi:hypothetical protein
MKHLKIFEDWDQDVHDNLVRMGLTKSLKDWERELTETGVKTEVPTHVLNQLEKSEDFLVRWIVAKHPNSSPGALDRIATSTPPIRSTVSQNPNIRADVLDRLSSDDTIIITENTNDDHINRLTRMGIVPNYEAGIKAAIARSLDEIHLVKCDPVNLVFKVKTDYTLRGDSFVGIGIKAYDKYHFTVSLTLDLKSGTDSYEVSVRNSDINLNTTEYLDVNIDEHELSELVSPDAIGEHLVSYLESFISDGPITIGYQSTEAIALVIDRIVDAGEDSPEDEDEDEDARDLRGIRERLATAANINNRILNEDQGKEGYVSLEKVNENIMIKLLRFTEFVNNSSINEDFHSERPIISPIEKEDIPEIIEICVDVFSDVDTPDGIREYLGANTDWSISKKCMIGNKVISCYLFNEDPVSSMLDECSCALEDYSKYDGLRGLQGLGLALLPEYRGAGIGKLMRDVPLSMPYDYVWGRHLKGLHNIDNWTRFGRRVIGENEEEYVTIMDLQ